MNTMNTSRTSIAFLGLHAAHPLCGGRSEVQDVRALPEGLPSNAVTWEKKKPAKINPELCTKCKSCIRACKFWAIE